MEQPEDQQGAVLLWGAAVDWLPRFSRDKGALWNKGCTSKMDTAVTSPHCVVKSHLHCSLCGTVGALQYFYCRDEPLDTFTCSTAGERKFKWIP